MSLTKERLGQIFVNLKTLSCRGGIAPEDKPRYDNDVRDLENAYHAIEQERDALKAGQDKYKRKYEMSLELCSRNNEAFVRLIKERDLLNAQVERLVKPMAHKQ